MYRRLPYFRDHKGHLVILDHQESKVQKEILEKLVLLVKMAKKDLKVSVVPQVSVESVENQVQLVNPEKLDVMGKSVHLEQMEKMAAQVPPEPVAIMELQEQLVLLVCLVHQDQKVPVEVWENLVQKDLVEIQERLVFAESVVKLAFP